MCFSVLFGARRDRLAAFESAQDEVRRHDFSGKDWADIDAYRQYQRRNSFGLDPDMKIYRIFQEDFYDKDVVDGFLTLPRAEANVWKDPLENPLSSVTVTDTVTGCPIHLGSTVSNFFALCWTRREKPTKKEWESFSHGRPAVRIATTIGKLMGRVMKISDSAYMHRSWLVDVDYKNPKLIEQMKSADEVYRRMESSGALLALSAAVVRTGFSDEREVRYLFDNGVLPKWAKVTVLTSPDLVRIPFDWNGFVEDSIRHS
jgi:hypothetical protein